MKEFLKKQAEEIPSWIANHKTGSKIKITDVSNSRIVYYPGSGDDGQPVHTFVETHAAHVFFYVDYMLPKKQIQEQLDTNGFRGYHVIDSVEISEKDLTPNGWKPHVKPTGEKIEMMRQFATVPPYCQLIFFERDAEYGEDHGAKRFAIFFLCGDGIASYDAIFCNNNLNAPYCILLQDHGFGGNWNKFGRGGMMEEAARLAHVYPKYIMATTQDSTRVWEGYERIPRLVGVLGGQNRNVRNLYARTSDI